MNILTITTGILSLSLPLSTSASINPPPGCPLPTWTVTSFTWHNGSHSLDCIHNAADIATKGCLYQNTWATPNETTCASIGGSWVNVCYTGMPNYSPWGYGSPQTLDIKFTAGPTCHDEYIGYRVHDIGNGESNCGYADRAMGRIISFYGSSNQDTSTGRMEYILGAGHALACANGRRITYSGQADFALNCVHDAFFNASCTAEPFEIPVLGFEWVE